MKNKDVHRSRISGSRINEIVRYFEADLTALQTAQRSGLNLSTVNLIYRGLRKWMLFACEAQRQKFGIVEVDQSFFGARRVKGKRLRGLIAKPLSLAYLNVLDRSIPRLSLTAQRQHCRELFAVEWALAVTNSDGWRGHNGLVDLGCGHYRVDHSKMNSSARRFISMVLKGSEE